MTRKYRYPTGFFLAEASVFILVFWLSARRLSCAVERALAFVFEH